MPIPPKRTFAGCSLILICLLSPVTIGALSTLFAAAEWREYDEPLPFVWYVIDGIFLTDLLATILLPLASPRWWGLMALWSVPLLCLTAWLAFWGGLCVSGQWL
jgi:hypothetical protein